MSKLHDDLKNVQQAIRQQQKKENVQEAALPQPKPVGVLPGAAKATGPILKLNMIIMVILMFIMIGMGAYSYTVMTQSGNSRDAVLVRFDDVIGRQQQQINELSKALAKQELRRQGEFNTLTTEISKINNSSRDDIRSMRDEISSVNKEIKQELLELRQKLNEQVVKIDALVSETQELPEAAGQAVSQ